MVGHSCLVEICLVEGKVGELAPIEIVFFRIRRRVAYAVFLILLFLELLNVGIDGLLNYRDWLVFILISCFPVAIILYSNLIIGLRQLLRGVSLCCCILIHNRTVDALYLLIVDLKLRFVSWT